MFIKKVFIFIQIVCASFFSTSQYAIASKHIYTGMFGVYAWENRDAALKIIKSNGFDIAIVNTIDIPTLNKIGLKGIIAFSLTKEIAEDNLKFSKFTENLKTQIQQYKDNPAIFAWYLVDEPELQKIPVNTIIYLRNLVLAIDNTHPLFTVMHNPSKWKTYLPYFEIVAEDKYLDNALDTPDSIRHWIRLLKSDVTKLNLKTSIWSVVGALELRRKDMRSIPRRPSVNEFTNMINISKEEGVDGILIYSLAFKESKIFQSWTLPTDDPLLWETVKSTPKLLDNNTVKSNDR